MSRNPFASVIFFAFAIPMLGWMKASPWYLLSLIPAALACWVIANSTERCKLSMKVMATIYFLVGVGMSLAFSNSAFAIFSWQNALITWPAIALALVLSAILSDVVTGYILAWQKIK